MNAKMLQSLSHVLQMLTVKFTNGGLSFFPILFFIFIFMLFYFSIFLFLGQLGLRLIGHAVTSVTT